MPISNRQRTRNTDALFAHLNEKRVNAEREPAGVIHDVRVKTAGNAEWYTLCSILEIDAMRDIYDTTRIAQRLDVLMKALREESSMPAKAVQ